MSDSDGVMALLLGGPAPEETPEPRQDSLEVSELDKALAKEFLQAGSDEAKLAKLFHMIRKSKE